MKLMLITRRRRSGVRWLWELHLGPQLPKVVSPEYTNEGQARKAWGRFKQRFPKVAHLGFHSR